MSPVNPSVRCRKGCCQSTRPSPKVEKGDITCTEHKLQICKNAKDMTNEEKSGGKKGRGLVEVVISVCSSFPSSPFPSLPSFFLFSPSLKICPSPLERAGLG